MGKLARISWPQEYSELQRIEELLLCGICYDYMDTSVMTPCSHNYCSLCIRKYLHYKTQCPACFEKTFEKDLHTNRILDELVSYFSKIREKLVDCIAGARIIDSVNNEDIVEGTTTSSTPVRPARTNQCLKKPSPKVEAQRNEIFHDSAAMKAEVVTSLIPGEEKLLSSPSTSGVTRIAKIFTPKRTKNSSSPAGKGKTLPCPVCRVDVSEFHINKHLDDCLKRESATQEPARHEPKRKPLPKLVFSLMKDAELRKKMKDLGLPSQGDRKTLEARFHRYSTLHNAECDRREPRPIEELLRQCENEENTAKKMLKFSQAANRLNVTRNCEQNIIEEAQQKYLEMNRQNYQSLIASMKEREKNHKPTVRRSLIEADDPSSGQNSANNLENHTTESEDDPASYSMNAYEATFQDSDSSSSCPLQHYASDDPMNFLALEMFTSDTSISPTKTTSKPETSNHERINDNSILDAPLSSIKNTTLRDINGDKMTKEFMRKNDIYCATIDNETSDEDVVSPDTNFAIIGRTKKRPKLSLEEKIRNNADPNELVYNRSEGEKLAISIARDFTFDTSSNDSVESDAQNEIPDKTTTTVKSSADEARRCESTEAIISTRDKENHETSATTRRPSIVERPRGKRNCVLRSEKHDSVDSGRINDSETATHVSPNGSACNDDRENDELSPNLRVDGPLKRRRRRKAVPKEPETTSPPRRPLRKRLVNSVSASSAKK